MALIFPKDLAIGSASGRKTSEKYGNQFMAFYINEESQPTQNSENRNGSIVKDVRGRKLRSLGFTSGGSIRSSSRQTIESIYLPVPLKISTNYGVEYSSFDLGTEAVDLALSAGGAALGQIGIVGQTLGGLPGAITNLIGSDFVQRGAELGVKTAGLIKGVSLNPHKELLFKGVNLRQFEFIWKLIARSEEESEIILNITNAFRRAMHPKLEVGSLLYRYPSDFDIEFFKIQEDEAKPNNFLTFVGPCVLKEAIVNYSGTGEYVTFKDTGAPVDIDLTLRFEETVVITKDALEAVGG